jgi:hypothetical protein
VDQNEQWPDPVEVATRVRRALNDRSQADIEVAVKEALRAFRQGQGPDESVEVGRRAVDERG